MSDKPPEKPVDGPCDEPAENVGPGRPPRHTRFKPGQSGNPNGRPKGCNNFATILQQQLRKKVTITVDGKPKRMAVQEVIARRLAKLNSSANNQNFLNIKARSEVVWLFWCSSSGEQDEMG